MRKILAQAHADVLAQLAWANVLIALDFDGTLSPIVADRDAAAMRDATRPLLEAVCARYPCAVISGRGRADVEARLCGAPVRYVVGNHGIEPSGGMEGFEAAVKAMRRGLAASLAGVQGVEIEDKRYSLAVHYRRSRASAAARAAIEGAIAALPMPTRVVAGKRVVNVLPQGAPHKGIALAELQTLSGTDVALYVGDDVTDEDVFESERPGRLIGVRVGRSPTSAASYFIDDQLQMDELLQRLAALRPAPSGGGARGRTAP
jgi:trehalose 6-phosphate phosphatase